MKARGRRAPTVPGRLTAAPIPEKGMRRRSDHATDVTNKERTEASQNAGESNGAPRNVNEKKRTRTSAVPTTVRYKSTCTSTTTLPCTATTDNRV